MGKNYSIKTFLPALMLALFSPLATAGAMADDGDIVISDEVITPTPSFFVRSYGNLFGTAKGTAPEGWTLSFPNADAAQYDDLAAGVKTAVSPYSMPQMKDGTFSASPKTLTRLERTVALADLGITDNVLAAFAEKEMPLTLNIACDAEAFYFTLGQDANPTVKFRAELLRADKSRAGAGDMTSHLYEGRTTDHLLASAAIDTKEANRPAYVKLTIDMKPCDGMEDFADEGVSVGNVFMYVSTDDIVTKNITVDYDYAGTLAGEGEYVSMPEGQGGSTAHIMFDSAESFTRAVLKDVNGNIVATCGNRGDNRAVLPVNVTQALKTDYELTGTPTNPDYDPDDEDYDEPDDGTTTLTLELEGVTPTAIDNVKADDNYSAAPKRIFNTAGQEVSTPQPGQIYIVDGKKGLVK